MLVFKTTYRAIDHNLSEMQAILQKHPNWPNLPEPQEVEACKEQLLALLENADKKGQAVLFEDE